MEYLSQAQFDQKLKELRTRFQDDSSLGFLDDMGKEYRAVLADRKFLNHPTFQKIANDAEKRINDINALLMNDEEMDEVDRIHLIAQRKAYRFIFERFGLKVADDALNALVELADSKLAM